jgi:uncharacterized membrane protein
MVALALYVGIFLVLWLPVYVARSSAGLFLWPIAVLVHLTVGALSIFAIVCGSRGLKRARADAADTRRKALVGITVGAFLIILAGPILWLGDIPLVLLTGQSGYGL